LSADAAREFGLSEFRAAWRIALPTENLSCKKVSFVILALDRNFPWSQPILFTPELKGDINWPHVEPTGKCCLAATDYDEEPGRRVIQHLKWLWEVFTYSADEIAAAYSEEFHSYWSQRLSKNTSVLFVALFAPDGQSREIVVHHDVSAKQYILGPDDDALAHWLDNAGRQFNRRSFGRTWVLHMDPAPAPQDYPAFGRDVLMRAPADGRERVLLPGVALPVLMSHGRTFGGVLLPAVKEANLYRGFRKSRLPFARIEESFARTAVLRCPAVRADGAWIHGRDHDLSFAALSQSEVAIVGCGALGSALAMTLAQAGVGKFVLLDDDKLSTGNVSRHVLGLPYVGQNKAAALTTFLRRSYPHLKNVIPLTTRFERLTNENLQRLAACDVVITAGTDISTDGRLDDWRRQLDPSPALVVTWVEEYALGGHAVAIFDDGRLLDGFDAKGVAAFRLTSWPNEAAATMIREPGCGNFFQPHGAVDLLPTVSMAGDLVLDVLLERVRLSERRVWKGMREKVAEMGGVPLPAFDASNRQGVAAWDF
jgi:hypothetical protein